MSRLKEWFASARGAPAPATPAPAPVVTKNGKLDLLITAWPSFPHFRRFVQDRRLAGIRLNSAMLSNPELDKELKVISETSPIHACPLFFDVKARQPRIVWVDHTNKKYLDLRLNHPIEVKTPCPVLFKAGADDCELDHLEEGGKRLIFRGGPHYKVKEGESLYIRDPNLKIMGDLFIPEEVAKIEKCRAAGFKKWFLSYVEEERDLDRLLELTGKDAEVWLKIESMRGLNYVARNFKKRENVVLVAARGDMYVEIDRPDQIASALKLIVEKDPEACAASRILLSVNQPPVAMQLAGFAMWLRNKRVNLITATEEQLKEYAKSCTEADGGQVPACADFLELQWLYDVGYRRMMLCDELCLKEDLLATAVNAFEAFRREAYSPRSWT